MLNLSKFLAIGLLVLGLVFGVMAWMGYSKAQRTAMQQSAAAPASSATPSAPEVVTLRRAVAAGQRLQAQDLVLRPVTPQTPQDALRSMDAVLAQVVSIALPEGTAIQPVHLVRGLSSQLLPGERAVAVVVEEGSAVAHRIQPGDWVDVHFLLKRDDREVTDTQARLLLSRKRVLAYGPKSTETAAQTIDPIHLAQQQGSGDNKNPINPPSSNSGPPPTPRTAVLAVLPEDVNYLALAEQQGVLRLALRHPGDEASPAPNGQPWTAASGPVSESLDKASIGLALQSLAQGTAPRPALAPLPQPVPVVAATPASRRPVAPRSASSRGTNAAGGDAVEVIRGAQRETIRY